MGWVPGAFELLQYSGSGKFQGCEALSEESLFR